MAGAVFLTWNDSQRSRSLCRVVGLERVLLVAGSSGMRRHVGGLVGTAFALARRRPDLIWYQFSLALGILLAAYRALGGGSVRLVADVHTKALRRSGPRLLRPLILPLKRWALRSAQVVIVSNDENARFADAVFGTESLVLPDPLPTPVGTRIDSAAAHAVIFVCSFALDEPLQLIADAARKLAGRYAIWVTGDPTKLPAVTRAALDSATRLTGFLPGRAYWAALRSARCVAVLSSDPACLPCGAYEAICVGKRPILADDGVARAIFGDGAIYTPLTVDGVTAAVEEAATGAVGAVQYYELRWTRWWAEVSSTLRSLDVLPDLSPALPAPAQIAPSPTA